MSSYYYRKPENKLDNLLLARRNLFLQVPGGGYVLVAANLNTITMHFFERNFRGDPVKTLRFDMPPGLFDGQGWNLVQLPGLLELPDKVT